MPQRTEKFSVAHISKDKIPAAIYGAMLKLGWKVKYAGPNAILAHTPKKAFSWNDEVQVVHSENEIAVQSSLIHNEAFDLLGKNKRHISHFMAAFDQVSQEMTAENLTEWNEKLEEIKAATIVQAEVETKEAEEIDKVMNFSKGGMQITYGLMAVNIVVFVLTAISGVSIISPKGGDLLPWGANFAPMTSDGQWWRLFTSMFLHFGIIHLAMNMFTLFYIGSQLEPMLGKTRYIVAYICAGLMGSMASLMWHSDGSAISAGASGAVFGIAGVFLALLLTNLVPKAIRKSMLQSIGIFVAYNIFYGMRPNSGIDNAAHLGGLIGGMAIGFVYYFSLGERFSSSRRNMQVAAVSVVTVALMVLSLKGRYNQDALFRGKFQEFAVAEELAMKPLRE